MVALHIRDGSGQDHVLTARAEDSVMQVARAAGLPVAGECNGSMACATCHVIVDAGWTGRLPPPEDDEEATLDTLFNLSPTSRLGCQIRLTEALDGLRLRLPPR
jgi:2Fe-2S ferredoxin